jgi:hypothetical protein
VRFEPTNSTIVPAARGSGHPQQGKEGAPLPAHVAMGSAQRRARSGNRAAYRSESLHHSADRLSTASEPAASSQAPLRTTGRVRSCASLCNPEFVRHRLGAPEPERTWHHHECRLSVAQFHRAIVRFWPGSARCHSRYRTFTRKKQEPSVTDRHVPEGDRRERQLCRNQKSPQSLGLNVNV